MLKNGIAILFIIATIFLVSGYQVHAKEQVIHSNPELQQAVKMNIMNYNQNFTVVYKGKDSNIADVLTKLIPNLLEDSKEVKANLKNYRYSGKYTSEGLIINYRINYYTSYAKEQLAKAEMNKQVSLIKKQHSTTLAKIKAVNDYIVKNTEYSQENGDNAFTKYGLIYQKKAVCQGYALVTEYMLERLGIPVEYVAGSSRSEKHAWNKVKINNKWYNIDTTWNDTKRNNAFAVSYKYFLVSDKVLMRDHKWNRSLYSVSNSENFDFLSRSSSMELHKDQLYFSYDVDNQKMYGYNLKNGKIKKLSNTRVQYLTYLKDKIYLSNYSDGGRLATYNLKTRKISNINNRYSQFVHTNGKNIYFISNNRYYKQII